MNEERMRILEMVGLGQITAAQAADLLHALEGGLPAKAALPASGSQGSRPSEDPRPAPPMQQAGPPEAGEVTMSVEPAAGGPPADLAKWRSWWIYPFTGGALLTALGAILLNTGNQAGWAVFWLICPGILVFFGAVVMLLSFFSRTARWLHIRVDTGEQDWPRRVAISLPLPLRMGGRLLQLFGNRISALKGVPAGDVILALAEAATPENPLYIEVEQGGGRSERVKIFIG